MIHLSFELNSNYRLNSYTAVFYWSVLKGRQISLWIRFRNSDDDSALASRFSLVAMERIVDVNFDIRLYGHSMETSGSHSLYIADLSSWTSPKIGNISIDICSTTFAQLRDKLQYERTCDMDRRTRVFQEAISIMDSQPNVFDRPEEDRRTYLIGFVHKGSNRMKISPFDNYQTIECFLEKHSFFSRDLILIPFSQLPQ